MPYRIDLAGAGDATMERLVELGALDIERAQSGELAALMPDNVTPDQIARAIGTAEFALSPAVARDDGSVWVLSLRAVHVGRLRIVPAHIGTETGALKLTDSSAFGTGLHPTTALCLEALDKILQMAVPASILDVGTGSGVLALSALMLGVPRAVGVDTDDEALRAAAENARINGLDQRLQLVNGGPEAVAGTWPLVVANILSAPLIEMAPALVRRAGHQGHVVLSGIQATVDQEVGRAYQDLGMRLVATKRHEGWVALVLQASW